MTIKVQIYLTMVLVSVLFTSCQSDFEVEDLTGSWSYKRENSNTFNYLLDTDVKGTMSFASDGSGVWNDSEGAYNFNLEWALLDDSQEIEITKFNPQTHIFVNKQKFSITRINNSTIMLEWMKQIKDPWDYPLVVDFFEKIELKRL